MVKNIFLITITVFFVFGCTGEIKQIKMRDESGGMKTIDFPKGTIVGGASKEQANTLAQTFVDSHNMVMKEMEESKGLEKKSLESQETIKMVTKRIEESTQRIGESNKKIFESSQRNFETTQKALQMIEQLSKKQGTGEVTIFFPVGSSQIKKESLEYERLVKFVDYLSRKSKERKVLFVSIGSASAFGDKKLNQKLAKKRSEAPIEVIDKYLVHIPHEFFKVYGTGDVYSPKNVPMKEHQKYQNVRLIAFYETENISGVPIPKEPVSIK